VLTRLKAADIVIFTGGDQRLTSILGGLLFKIFYWINTNEEFVYAEHLLVLQQLLTI
jgi:cyanophycinase